MGRVLNDEILTTALLDRMLHWCEVTKLTGRSYRMKYRKLFLKIMNYPAASGRGIRSPSKERQLIPFMHYLVLFFNPLLSDIS